MATKHKQSADPQADQILASLAEARAELEAINSSWDAAIQELERQYGERARAAKNRVDELEKQLTKHAKSRKDELFQGTDRVELKNGALLRNVSRRVKRAKKVTPEVLESLGYTDGVRVEKKVWWERLEEWPDEKLIQVGTERVNKESFEYEIYK